MTEGAAVGDGRMRIDELARRSGTTSRNVRAYQARGLLPPPVLEGRTGFYGEEHLHRLRLVTDLQDRGFSLAAIQQTLETLAAGGDLSHLLGLHHVLSAPWTDEQPGEVTREQLQEQFTELGQDESVLPQAVEEGVLVEVEDGRYEVPSPVLLQAGAELARVGVPLRDVLRLVGAIRVDMADVADRFVDLVTTHLVDEVSEGRASPERISDVTRALVQLRPLALEVVRPFLAQEMRRAVETALLRYGRQASRFYPDGENPAPA